MARLTWPGPAARGRDSPAALRSAVRKVLLNVIAPLALAYFLMLMDRVAIGFAAPAIGAALTMTPPQVGLAAPVLFLGILLFAVPSAVLANRFGARRWLAVLLCLSGLAAVGTAFAAGSATFFAARMVAAIAQAALLPTALFLSARWVPAAFRTRLTAWVVLTALAGVAVGQPLHAGLAMLDGVAGLAGWRWFFLAAGLPCLPLAWWVLRRVPDVPREAPWLTEDEGAALAWSRSVEPRETREDTAFSALLDPRLLLLAGINAGLALSAAAAGTWYALLMQDQRAPLLPIGLLFLGVTTITVLLWPHRIDRTGRVLEGLTIAAALATVAYAAGVLRGPTITMLVGLAAHAATIEAARTMMWSVAGRLSVAGRGGVATLAVIDATGQVAAFVAPRLITGAAEKAGNLQFGLVTLTLIPLAVCVLAGVLRLISPRN